MASPVWARWLLRLRQVVLDVTLRDWWESIGAVAQLGERRVRNAEVEGSSPFRSIVLHVIPLIGKDKLCTDQSAAPSRRRVE